MTDPRTSFALRKVAGVSAGACGIWQYESRRSLVQDMKSGYSTQNKFWTKAGQVREQVSVAWKKLA